MPPTPTAPRQRPIFWISLATCVVLTCFLIWVASLAGPAAVAVAVSAVVALAVTVVTIGAFAWSVARRMRRLAARLPHAITIPITVGHDLANGSRQLAKLTGDDEVILKPSSYAALAFDGAGIHVAGASDRGGLIPAGRVEVAGFGRSLLGTREMTSIRLLVWTDVGVVELPFVPMRRRGNPIRQLTPEQFERLVDDIGSALSGHPIAVPGWPY